MNILYISCLCSKAKYAEIFNNSKEKPGQQIQKYHRLMTEGLSKCENTKVTIISGLPVSRAATRKIYFKKQLECKNNISYIYLPFINLPICRHLALFISCFFSTLNFCIKNKDVIIICDILNISVSIGAILASKLSRVRSIGIVTDAPNFLDPNNKKKSNILRKSLMNIIRKINNNILNYVDSYVFLTEQMNELINGKQKPYVILEGQVDINMQNVYNSIENKYVKKICLYAGALKSIYGLDNLTEAFIKANIDGAELHIYGSGSFEEELKSICRKHKNIKYFGVVTNDVVVKEQLKATLLLNPRPTNEEFTKYSFPSKNMEYMVSGTPILTTKLPGMPQEYYPYIYLFDDETVEGMIKSIEYVLSKDSMELYIKGFKAKEFVLREKNNIKQAQKIIEMILTKGLMVK